MADNSLLNRLDGLVSRFEEVGTLITDPSVIADMKRFVKLWAIATANCPLKPTPSLKRTG